METCNVGTQTVNDFTRILIDNIPDPVLPEPKQPPTNPPKETLHQSISSEKITATDLVESSIVQIIKAIEKKLSLKSNIKAGQSFVINVAIPFPVFKLIQRSIRNSKDQGVSVEEFTNSRGFTSGYQVTYTKKSTFKDHLTNLAQETSFTTKKKIRTNTVKLTVTRTKPLTMHYSKRSGKVKIAGSYIILNQFNEECSF